MLEEEIINNDNPEEIESNGSEEEAEITKEQVEELQRQLEEKEKELVKLKAKDFNFKRLEHRTKEELEKMSTMEKEILQRQEKLEDEQKNFAKGQMETYKSDALSSLTGEDKNLKEKILFHYDRIKDEANTREDIKKKMEDAAKLAGTYAERPMDYLSQALSHRGSSSPKKEKGFAETEEGKNLAKMLNLNIAKENK